MSENKFQIQFDKMIEKMELTAPIIKKKEKVLYTRLTDEQIKDLREMQKLTPYKKRSDFIRALLDDVITTYKKAKESK